MLKPSIEQTMALRHIPFLHVSSQLLDI